MTDENELEYVLDLPERPRRNRRTDSIRRMVRETHLSPDNLIWPVFVVDGEDTRQPISSMPGVERMSIDVLVGEVKEAEALGIPAVALFPAIDESLKDSMATESTNPDGLLQRTIKALKEAAPALTVITDVAMDPYSSDGHDGIVRDGVIVNDETLEVLAAMAIAQAKAGADIVAPSDMMDGRVGFIRESLDEAGFTDVGILAYTAKYASSFYGPFRDALESAPRFGDKKTYQMDPANGKEALRELTLDIEEGADMVMVKPALPYLDVLWRVKEASSVPVAAYHVSGEYAMLIAAGEKGWLDHQAVMMESHLCIRRAGADVILTYAAKDVARFLQG
ncbi:MAG TPA: porphobilinogen synthase [Planctomycetes bacterium]|nr:porphobilinogen synthase [Planctomycetota bacterium]